MAICRSKSKAGSVAIAFAVITALLLLSVLSTVCWCGLLSMMLKRKARSFYATGFVFLCDLRVRVLLSGLTLATD